MGRLKNSELEDQGEFQHQNCMLESALESHSGIVRVFGAHVQEYAHAHVVRHTLWKHKDDV